MIWKIPRQYLLGHYHRTWGFPVNDGSTIKNRLVKRPADGNICTHARVNPSGLTSAFVKYIVDSGPIAADTTVAHEIRPAKDESNIILVDADGRKVVVGG
jgi:hypothetical protein